MSNNQKIVLPVSIGDYANVLQYFMAQIFDVKIIAYVLDQLQDKISLIESFKWWLSLKGCLQYRPIFLINERNYC